MKYKNTTKSSSYKETVLIVLRPLRLIHLMYIIEPVHCHYQLYIIDF